MKGAHSSDIDAFDVPEEPIVEDSALTTIGLKPFFPVLMGHFKSKAVYKDN